MKEKLIINKKSLKGEDGYKTFSIRIKDETVAKLDKLANETNRSRNELINILLDYAIKNNCSAILSVPCCQHEINNQLSKNKNIPEEFVPLTKYGLIKERFASLVTDALRAEYLEQAGYSVQILEFIDMEHTPKNILIRAVKTLHQNEKSKKQG